MRVWWMLSWLGVVGWLMIGCRSDGSTRPPPDAPPPPAAPSPTATLQPVATIVVEPTPTDTTVTIWGPPEFAPGSEMRGAELLRQQTEEFETLNPTIHVVYEPKADRGPASLLEYIRSASAVAPAILPDLVIIPTAHLEEVAQTQLLAPLDSLLGAALREDLYPFAARDTQVDGEWIALPLGVQAAHGVTRSGERPLPATLDELVAADDFTWLFVGQAGEGGQMSDAFLLQLLALHDQLPAPAALPPQDDMVRLMEMLQRAQAAGAIPRQVLLLEESADLFARLRARQADLIQSTSRDFLLERDQRSGTTFAPLPTLTGEPVTVVDGYLIGVATVVPRQQQAAAQYLNWLLDPARWGARARATHWLPASRRALAEAVVEEAYRQFLDERLERGWIRPSRASWGDFAQVVQEQFRAVLLEQATPSAAAEALYERYAP